jgi:hypothetical protein
MCSSLLWIKAYGLRKRGPPNPLHLKVWGEINVKNKYQVPWVLLGSVCINMDYVTGYKI